MAALSPFLRSIEGGRVLFFCPGCKTGHQVIVTGNHAWGYNGNPVSPTFTPSILCSGTEPITDEEYARIMDGEKITPRPKICHSFVTDGQIQFLSDCTHALAGQTVPIPIFPGYEG